MKLLNITLSFNSALFISWMVCLPEFCNMSFVCIPLQKMDLKTTYSSHDVFSCESCSREYFEILTAVNVVRTRHLLSATRTWIASHEILSYGMYIVRKGQGVVGKAFSSKSACFCRDIRQLGITEHPLVPIARCYKHSACFAVCLQSSCSNNCIYVLEFLLPRNEKDHGDPRTLLHMLMETLTLHLQSSFKIASGQEFGKKLSVEVIKVSSEDKFDSFELCNTIGDESTPRPAEVRKPGAMVQLDFSSQQVDAANGSTDGIHEQQNGSVGSTPRLAAQGGGEIMQVDFSSHPVDTANGYINGVHGQQSGIVGSPPRSEHVQGFVNISYQELMAVQINASNVAGVEAGNNSINGIYEQQNGIVGSSTEQELAQNIVSIANHEPIAEINVADPERDGPSIEQRGNEVTDVKKQKSRCTLKSELGITREVLEQISKMKLVDAAKFLDVSRSTLKRICREYGIRRWPPRKARKVIQAFAVQKVIQPFAVQKVIQPSTENIEGLHWSDATRLENGSCMWVKADYQQYKIKFRLPLSARKVNLEEKVAQRLNLSIGSFKIEYEDEDNDWIWITCDEDLSTSMSTLSSLGRTTIKMLVS
ncbi:unnamed protein product [Coffea canephora]|uniref:RWP-RK domain-containing protein n=1 Tax=Coffea canephora TaxID=49390 RepID=A0A068V565_COFCA|nr:unnamed protein product [Coffea canephora]